MRVAFTIVGTLLWAGIATSAVDPDVDQIGVYWDLEANETCASVPVQTQFSVYVIITNPSVQEIWGVEFSLCALVVEGAQSSLFRLGTRWFGGYVPPVDLGFDWCDGGGLFGFASPFVPSGGAVPLVEIPYVMVEPLRVEFYLGPSALESIEDGLPAYAGIGYEIVPLGVSSGDTALPVAVANGDCTVVPTEGAEPPRVSRRLRHLSPATATRSS